MECPNCKAELKQTDLVGKSTNLSAAWFQLTGTELYCPKCDSKITFSSRPQILAGISSIIYEGNHDLIKVMNEIKTLQGIIPICSYCHSIRDDEGAWSQIESYISKHSHAKFSHGICPKCDSRVRADAGL